jgi:hypothetical protein
MEEQEAPQPEALSSTEEEIRQLAYQYWEERGRPDGAGEEDWLRAEEEIARRETPPLTRSATV